MIAASYIEYFSMCLHQRVAPNIEHLRIVPSHQAWNTYYVSVCFDEEKERRWRRSESSFSHHFLHIRHIAWQMKVNGSPVHQWYWDISTLFQVLFFWSILYQEHCRERVISTKSIALLLTHAHWRGVWLHVLHYIQNALLLEPARPIKDDNPML